MIITSFHPPQRTLMGPGPSDVYPRVLEAMGRPTIGHLDPVFVAMMDELKDLLRYAFQTRNALTMPVSAPGSAGMETAFVNLVEPGDTVVVCQNGVFGGRMKENVERCGGTAVLVEDAWGAAVDPDKVEDALKAIRKRRSSPSYMLRPPPARSPTPRRWPGSRAATIA
jgi:alanine-glyoxylate transaminase / serine-glyoxylate transaminase / serine-pyruvate transaminase